MATKTTRTARTVKPDDVFIDVEEHEIETDIPVPGNHQHDLAVYDERAEEILDHVERIRAMHGKLSDDAAINLYRVDKNGQDGFIAKMSPTDYDLDFVKKNYGGGDYRIRGYHKVNGRNQLFINEAFRIEESISEKMDRERQGSMMLQGNNAGMGDLANVMMQGFERMQQTMIQVMQQDNEEKIINRLRLLKEITGPAPAAVDPVKQIESIVSIVGLVDKLRGGGGETDPLTKAMEMFGPVLMGAMNQPQPAQQIQQPEITAQIEHQEAQPESGDNVKLTQKIMLKGLIMQLLQQAEKGRDPGAYAYIVINRAEDMGDAAMQNLYEFIIQDNYFEQLCALEPKVRTHEKWFTEMRDALLAEFGVEPESEPGPVSPVMGVAPVTYTDQAVNPVNLTQAAPSGIESVHVDQTDTTRTASDGESEQRD